MSDVFPISVALTTTRGGGWGGGGYSIPQKQKGGPHTTATAATHSAARNPKPQPILTQADCNLEPLGSKYSKLRKAPLGSASVAFVRMPYRIPSTRRSASPPQSMTSWADRRHAGGGVIPLSSGSERGRGEQPGTHACGNFVFICIRSFIIYYFFTHLFFICIYFLFL